MDFVHMPSLVESIDPDRRAKRWSGFSPPVTAGGSKGAMVVKTTVQT
jgi:hypothetical protein